MFKASTITAKLMALAFVATLGALTLAGFNWYSGRANSQALETVYESNVRSLLQLQRVDGLLREIRFRAAGVLLEIVSLQGSLNHLRESQKEMEGIWKSVSQSANGMQEEQRALLEEMNNGWKAVVTTLQHIEQAYTTKNNDQLTSALETEWAQLHKGFSKPLEKLLPLQERSARSVYDNAVESNALLNRISLLLAGAVALLTVGLGFIVSRNIRRQLGGEPTYAAQVVHAIADGDLTRDIALRSKDESSLLYAMKRMQDDLRGRVHQIQAAAQAITNASAEITAGNADLSQRTEQQASSLEETASSMEELTGTVKQNADNARQANQLAAGASTMAVKGGEVVGQVVHSMSSINESSKKIADIISVIDGIAFQTNILALNAAVEAARAGEQGRGFAVVASEVRTLAQRSAAAAKEIKALITDSVGKVEDGSKLVDQAGQTMEEIVTAVKRVTDIMAEIAAASQEQTSGIEQVNQAIVQMDQVTQQNAALVEEAAAAADSMQEQAQSLTKAVAIFKLVHAEVTPSSQPFSQEEKDSLPSPRGRGIEGEGKQTAPSPRVRGEGRGERKEPSHTEGKWDGKVERRGPNRAKNVARLPQPAPQPKAQKVANSDDNWQEF